MLVIRQAQMEVFRRASTDRFIARLARHLLASAPAEGAAAGGEAGVSRLLVQRILPRLGALGIDREAGATMMAEVMLRHGIELETSPVRAWALNLLGAANLPGHSRARIVWERHAELTGGRALAAVAAGG
jgi:hypothetical protein